MRMSESNASLDRAPAFPGPDPLRYPTHLKYLRLYPGGVACRYLEVEDAPGVLLSYRPALMAWDERTYPWADWIVLPAAETAPAAEALAHAAAELAGQGAFALKTCDP